MDCSPFFFLTPAPHFSTLCSPAKKLFSVSKNHLFFFFILSYFYLFFFLSLSTGISSFPSLPSPAKRTIFGSHQSVFEVSLSFSFSSPLPILLKTLAPFCFHHSLAHPPKIDFRQSKNIFSGFSFPLPVLFLVGFFSFKNHFPVRIFFRLFSPPLPVISLSFSCQKNKVGFQKSCLSRLSVLFRLPCPCDVLFWSFSRPLLILFPSSFGPFPVLFPSVTSPFMHFMFCPLQYLSFSHSFPVLSPLFLSFLRPALPSNDFRLCKIIFCADS